MVVCCGWLGLIMVTSPPSPDAPSPVPSFYLSYCSPALPILLLPLFTSGQPPRLLLLFLPFFLLLFVLLLILLDDSWFANCLQTAAFDAPFIHQMASVSVVPARYLILYTSFALDEENCIKDCTPLSLSRWPTIAGGAESPAHGLWPGKHWRCWKRISEIAVRSLRQPCVWLVLADFRQSQKLRDFASLRCLDGMVSLDGLVPLDGLVFTNLPLNYRNW